MMKFAILLVVGVIARQAYCDEPERIVGGKNAYDGQFPHQVSIQIQKLRLTNRHLCGGSLISKTHVLTAAHCVSDPKDWPNMSIVTGTNNLRRGGQRHEIKCIQIHPLHGEDGKGTNDIAVITLLEPIVVNHYQNPIIISNTDYRNGTERGIIIGWEKKGIFDIPGPLQSVSVQIISEAECQKEYPGLINDDNVCTFQGYGKGLCQGDSGGSLIRNNELIGITSWSVPCAKNKPDVHINVNNYLEFIQESQNKCP